MPTRRKTVVSPTGQTDDNDTARDLRSAASKSKPTSSRDDASMYGTPKRSEAQQPKALTVWDWELPTSSSNVDASDSYNEYESQGLLQKRPASQRQPAPAEFSIPLPVNHADLQRPSSMNAQHNGTLTSLKRKSTSDQIVEEGTGSKRASMALPDASAILPPHDPPSDSGRAARSEPSSISAPVANVLSGAIPDHDLDQSFIPPRTTKRGASDPSVVPTLPSRKVFSIQVGDRLFQLSGQSICSDAPSYFTTFFEDQIRKSDRSEGIGTLYIDRDPHTFQDIALHLQGYHVEPRDGPHFVKLFADAQYFSLPRLTTQLFASAIYIRIGDTDFYIPRDLFNKPGDSPNFFSLDISVFFTTPTDRSGGTNKRSLLRPPAILPPGVPNRSAKTFADLLHILKGYDVEIRNEQHRAELLRDARYFHLKGLEQRLIPHDITYNLARQRSEIRIRLEDIRQSGITFVPDATSGQPSAAPSPATSSSGSSNGPISPGWVFYQRPYADKDSHALIIEISNIECATMSIAPASASATARLGRVTFYNSTLARISSLLGVVATRLSLPSIQPLGTAVGSKGNKAVSLPSSPIIHSLSTSSAGLDERMKARIGPDADVRINGRRWIAGSGANLDDDEDVTMDADTASIASGRPSISRKASEVGDSGLELVLRRSQWRIRIQPVPTANGGKHNGMEAILGAVKLDAFTNERSRNAGLDFLQ